MAWAIGKASPPRSLLLYHAFAFEIILALAGHQPLTHCSSIFVHARDTVDRQALIPGSKVSFVFEIDDKGGKAKEVAVEEIAKAVVLDEGPREMGTVKVRRTASPYLNLRSRLACGTAKMMLLTGRG